MKDLIIISDNPITSNSCASILKEEFKSLILLNDDDDSLYMRRSHRGFEMWFTPNDLLNDPSCLMEDTLEKCPNKEAHLTNLGYTSLNIASRIIELLEAHYGNMWIQSDEEDNWFGTSKEFIEIYCNKKVVNNN